MGVAGVPAGAPAGSSAGSEAGNNAGETTVITDADRDMGSSRGTTFGTTPVSGTINTKDLTVPRVRFVIRGMRSGANTPDRATLNVMWQAGEPNATDLFRSSHPRGVTGGIEVVEPGATFQTHPSVGRFAGRSAHSFSLAQRGGTLHTGTITTEIQLVQD